MSVEYTRVSVDNEKYTVVIGSDGSLAALRYGEPWQDVTGNKFIYCLAAELDAARKTIAAVAPHPGSPEASAMIDSVLAEYGWPTNATNAARAGYVACMRLIDAAQALATHDATQAPAEAEPLYLLHCGQIDSSGEQDEWDIEADSYKRVEEFCRLHPGQTIKLYPQIQGAAEAPEIGEVTWQQAADAIENLDDYARMMVGVDPSGPRETLYRFLEQAKVALANVQPKHTAEVCAICGEGKALLMRHCDHCGSDYAGSAEMRANAQAPAPVDELRERIEELEEDVDRISVERDEALRGPWQEWATNILKMVREVSGYDGYDDADGVDLAEEVRELIAELTSQIERLSDSRSPAVGVPVMWQNRVRLRGEEGAEFSPWTECSEAIAAACPNWTHPQWEYESRALVATTVVKPPVQPMGGE